MFTIEGFIGGIPYVLNVDPTILDDIDVPPNMPNMLDGSPNVMALLSANVGTEIRPTPTGEAITVALNDPEAILGAAHGLTDVTSVTGSAPAMQESVPDRVY